MSDNNNAFREAICVCLCMCVLVLVWILTHTLLFACYSIWHVFDNNCMTMLLLLLWFLIQNQCYITYIPHTSLFLSIYPTFSLLESLFLALRKGLNIKNTTVFTKCRCIFMSVTMHDMAWHMVEKLKEKEKSKKENWEAFLTS